MQPEPITIRLSRTLSWALHPLVVPTLTVILLLFGDTVMSGILTRSKWLFVAMTGLSTLLIPAFSIALLHTLRILPENPDGYPLARAVPVLIAAVCFVTCAFMLGKPPVAFLIRRILFAGMACAIFSAIIVPFWKISLHMIGMGGLLAVLLLVNFSGYGQFTYTFLAFLLLAGLLGSARLCLNAENIWQVAAGFAAGFLITGLVILFS